MILKFKKNFEKYDWKVWWFLTEMLFHIVPAGYGMRYQG